MKKVILMFFISLVVLIYFISCHQGNFTDSNGISSDSTSVAKGEATFTKDCSGCHNFRQDAIGPQLAGITDKVPVDWISHFIRNSQKMIDSGDVRAVQLHKKYGVAMPSFATYSDEEVNDVIAFLNTHKKQDHSVLNDSGLALTNPIPDTIELSNLVVELKLFTVIPASSTKGKLPLTRITKLDCEPNTGNIFILDLRGKLYKMKDKKPEVYMDMEKLKPKFINQPGLGTGFGSFAFHPDFVKNGLLYTTHTEAAGSGKADFSFADTIKVAMQWVLTEWQTKTPGAATFSGSSRELLRVNMPSPIHGFQEITFNPLATPGDKDYGMLYLGVGEGGSVDGGYPFLAHSKHKIWGTILRIDPKGNNSANHQYGIPPDNPFAQSKDIQTVKEIYAWGFRNPHRITWTKTGEMLVSHIGGGNIESIDLIMPGHDYGWPIREGTFVLNPYGNLTKVYSLPSNDSNYHVTYPIAQYDHEGHVAAIAGGFEYWGNSIPQLKGKFLFGDISSGRLFFIELADIKQGKQATIKEWRVSVNGIQKTLKQLCGNDRVEIRFGRDEKGELYILTKADGKVYKLISAKN
ncbi:MAG: PQQ-dependent sugar dehydrogenase [Ginsengibacter sp.]